VGHCTYFHRVWLSTKLCVSLLDTKLLEHIHGMYREQQNSERKLVTKTSTKQPNEELDGFGTVLWNLAEKEIMARLHAKLTQYELIIKPCI